MEIGLRNLGLWKGEGGGGGRGGGGGGWRQAVTFSLTPNFFLSFFSCIQHSKKIKMKTRVL